ncbi:InlB B-repeat-containing protein [Epilithonimonas xixisoli]|uniref:Putative repeat protein (TIGR02543 family)/predicted secreted protein (Por secretion system target) n=1 Tax=Epilithonimonas xixisoli TaxID=1476462 RepID=A0A4R8I3X6_9FLAO|nr:InlB B-repeat-containing protein [Epilithonimonas xixisoli]TDX83004.1 putative repeat protein (TIGR02543 family)/predicted secreted protein (Por secretion system target) [Epilithonimonas xixisoli]
MKTNLFSQRTLFLVKSAKAFFLLFFMFVGVSAWGQTCDDLTWVGSGTGNFQGCGGAVFGFDSSGDSVTSSEVNNPQNLSFSKKRSGSLSTRTMTLQITTNAAYTTWATVATIDFSSASSCVSQTVDLSSYTGLRKIRFIDGSGDARQKGISNISLTCEDATTYTLTYNGNDNTSGTVPSAVTASSTTLAAAGTMAKSGYSFSGWNTNISGTGTNYNAGTTSYAISSDHTLYARWGFTVSYSNNGGAGTATAQTGYYNGTTGVKSGTLTLNNGSGFTRAGYTFGGWKTTAGGASANYSAGGVYTHIVSGSAITLYAHWVLNAATLTLSPNSLSGFTYSESNGSSASQNFTITGSTLDGSNVSILPGDDYEISIDNGVTWLDYSNAPVNVPYTGSSVSRQVSVRLKAGLAVGNYNNSSNHIIVVSGGGVSSSPEVALSGTVTACLAPTTQSTLSTFTAIGINGMTVNATAGNGVGRIIKINTTNSFTNPTSSNALPTANTVYAGSGEQVIYAGLGNTVAVTGLSHSTTYWYRVYEYNICSGNYIYNMTAPTNNPRSQATLCDVPAMPNGEVDVDPSCGSVDLVYQHGTLQPQSGVSYYWQTSANGTSTVNSTNNIYTVTTGGKYYVRGYNGSCWGPAFEMNDTVVILSPVSVATHPANQSATVGATATFAVTASNISNYQWQVSTNNGTTWTNVPSATASTYTTAATTLAMNGYRYRVRLSNTCGTLTSNVATLSVNNTPVSIWSNEITGTNPNTSNPYTIGDTKNANIEVSGIGRGSGITGTNANNRYTANGWNTSAIDLTAYFEFTLTPNDNYRIDLSSFEYTGQASGTGPTSFAFRSSIDDYVSNIGIPSANGISINLTSTDYQNLTSPITFRIYGWGASALGGTFSINDFNFKGNVIAACTPPTINAFPTTGPVGTIVTITGSNFVTGSTVKFGTANATVEYVSATEIKATVPAGADGNIIATTSLTCPSETSFTLIKEDASGCESTSGGTGSTPATDLIIYEVYDENGGTGGTITLFNGTTSSISLNNYILQRAGDYGETYNDTYITLTGSIAAGELGLVGVSGSKCPYLPTNGSISNGFNDNDGFRLKKGSLIIDDVKAPNYTGYYLKRKATNLSPKSTFDANDWVETSVDTDECLTGVGVAPTLALPSPPPTIVENPTYAISCEVNNAALTLTATEGYTGGRTLAYQWYVLGNNGTWTEVANTGVYSGATTATLNISNVVGLDNYQYYCQVRENTATCFTATNATQIKEATNTWTTASVWTNKMPVLASKVIIEGNYDTAVNGSLNVCELTVNAGGTMMVKANNPITVKKKIINNNTADNSFVVESDANLIQTDNIANEGAIKVERSVTGMNNDAATAIDYVYWSSPVSGQAIKGFSPNTPASGYQEYKESNDRFVVTKDADFLTGKGYAIRAEGLLSNGYSKVYEFKGVPNNGDLSTPPLDKSAGADKGYNLIGNPYPSNIDFDQFHALNSDKIYATAFFWTNNTYTKQQMGSGYAGNNYAVYNITGGVQSTYDDLNPNYKVAPNGKIKVGQAFIVQSKIAGALDFKNSVRVTDNGTFYQKTAPKNRFWLAMKAPNNLVNTILVGYIPGASNNYETDFDAELFAIGSDSFYSVLGARKLAIQGKANNFSTEDVIALGNVFAGNGTYTIRLENPEGLFNNNQNIYLKDNLLNKYINLSSEGSYTFEATKGTYSNRFQVVYKDGSALGQDQVSKSNFEVYRNGEHFVIRSSQKLGTVALYDASGRLVRQFYSKEKTLTLPVENLAQGVYIIKAENAGDVKTKKIIK